MFIMIKFIIDKIQLRNVRHYGDQMMEMDFPLDNLTVFTGPVGAGKSTILKSVSMALYGDDGGVKGEKLSIDDMVNERSGKNLEIHLYFRGIDTLNNNSEDKYEIHLYHKHTKMNNKLVFMKNGIDISANGKMDTYRLIEKTTIPKQVYHNIYYFTQQAKNFFTALPNGEQKEIFDSILDLGDYDIYYKNCRDRIWEYDKKLGEVQISIKMFESNIKDKENMLKTETENLKVLVENTKKEIHDIETEIDNLEKKYESDKIDLSLERSSSEIKDEISKTKQNLELKKNEIDFKIQSVKKDLQQIREKYEKIFSDEKLKVKEDLEKLNKPINDEVQKLLLDKQKMIHTHETEKSDCNTKKESEISNIKSKYELKEVTIKQEIKDKESELLNYQNKVKSEFLAKQQEINNSISVKEKEIFNVQVKTDRIDHRIKELNDEITRHQKEYDSNQVQIDSDVPICDKCGQPLLNLDRLKADQTKLTSLIDFNKKSIINYENEKIVKKSEETKIHEEISKLEETIDNLKKQFRQDYDTKKATILSEVDKSKKDLDNLNLERDSKIKEIESKYKEKLEKLEEDYNRKISEVESEISTKNSSIEYNTNEAKNKLIKLSQELQVKIKNESSVLTTSITEYDKQKSEIDGQYMIDIDRLNTQLFSIEETEKKLENLKFQIEQKKSELKVKREFKVSDETIKNIQSSIESDKVKLSEQKVREKEISDTITILEFWKSAFSDSGIKSMLIDVAIPHMNQCVREELDRVCPGVFTVSFDTLSETKSGNVRDKFSINIIHNLKCATGHKKLSGGEKRIIDFACMSALRSLAEKLYNKMFSHIFYDEVLDSLDSECRELFCRSMKNQSEDHRNITMVTHALTEDVDPDRVFPF